MCQMTYVGCERCGARTDSMTWYTEQTVIEHARLDEDGDHQDYEEPVYADPHDSGFKCETCGHLSNALDTECSDEECECSECDPETAVREPEDGDAIVLLRRTHHDNRPSLDEALPEVVKLFSDRAITVIPIRAERAAEIFDDLPLNVRVDTETFVPPHLQPEEAAA